MNRNAVRLSLASSVALALLFLGLATQCARHAAPQSESVATEYAVADSSSPQESAIPVERISPDAEPADEDAAKVRRATVEWVKSNRPDAKVDGIFMLAFAKGNLYLAGADAKFDGDRHETLDVLVRRYTRRNGGQYFRAESLDKDQANRLREKADFDADTTANDARRDSGWDDTGNTNGDGGE